MHEAEPGGADRQIRSGRHHVSRARRRKAFRCGPPFRVFRAALPSVILSALLVGMPAPPTHAAGNGFVARSGGTLSLDGLPFRFVGYNNYRLTDLPTGFACDPGRPPLSDQQLVDLLVRLKQNSGATVVRTWFFQVHYQQNPSRWGAFDRVLNAAGTAGLKVLPVLINHSYTCEPPYTNYNRSGDYYRTGYTMPEGEYALSFREYARTVASHYANDRRIAMWQLGNEINPDGGGCPSDAASVLRNFADDLTATIKSVDPNHLVSLGTIGTGQCGASNDDYHYIHAGLIDICEFHDYGQIGSPYPGDQYNGLLRRVDQCNALNKPLFIGEAGISINEVPVSQRAEFFRAKIDGAWNRGIDGYLIWEGIPEASLSTKNRQNGGYGVGPGDPTEAVLQKYGDCLQAITPSRHDFEDGTPQGWAADSRMTVTVPLLTVSRSNPCFSGKRSLAVTVNGGGAPAVSSSSGVAGLIPGSTVTYRVYAPPDAALPSVTPYMKDAAGIVYPEAPYSLAPGWNTISWQLHKASSVTGLVAAASIGFQINNALGWVGVLKLDAVAFSATSTLGTQQVRPHE